MQREQAGTLGAANRALLAQQFGAAVEAAEAQQQQQQGQETGTHAPPQAQQPQGDGAAGTSGSAGPGAGAEGGPGGGSGGGGAAAVADAAGAVRRLCEAAVAGGARAMLSRMLARHEAHVSLRAMHAAVLEQVGVWGCGGVLALPVRAA